MKRLQTLLNSIHGKGYKAYKTLKGSYRYNFFTLTIDHVQGDPYAAPTRINFKIANNIANIPQIYHSNPIRKLALQDYLARSTRSAIYQYVKGQRGIGKSGEIIIDAGGQEALIRNAVIFNEDVIEVRLTIGLPASGRTILGEEAQEMFFKELPEVIHNGVLFDNLSEQELKNHVESIEDQEFLRHWLSEHSLVAFVADNSHLPRRSGIDDRPLLEEVIPFKSPPALACTPTLPNAGEICGMGIPAGITLIVGGGFHGKSTLLHALERGVYNHISGDGRECVVTEPTAVKIRAEDGRVITHVNIRPFIDRLPFNRDTASFTTENASGSTSQAANIIEALEAGAKTLLIDEDTSATNFMIRDQRMQALVARHKEPITPLLHRIRELYDQHGISTVLVMGGSGDYFEVADTVIMMDAYLPEDVTKQAQQLAMPHQLTKTDINDEPFRLTSNRTPEIKSLDPSRDHRAVKIDPRGRETLIYGKYEIDLSNVEQCVDISQTRTIGLLIHYYATHYAASSASLIKGLKLALSDAQEQGLDILSPYKVGNLALPRLHELAAAINRMRGVKIS